MGRISRGKKEEDKEIAGERVEMLLELAVKTHGTDSALTQRYADLAKKIITRSKVRMPRQYKRLICKRCGRFIVPGPDARFRLRQAREPHLVITCLHCRSVYRIPLGRRKKDVKIPTKDQDKQRDDGRKAHNHDGKEGSNCDPHSRDREATQTQQDRENQVDWSPPQR